MPIAVASLWTLEQAVLSLAIVVGCAIVAFARGRPPKTKPEPQRTKAQRTNARVGLPKPRSRWPVALVVVIFAAAVFLLQRSFDPVGTQAGSWSDANIIVSGRNYAREGLGAHWGAAQHQVVTERNPPDPFFIYTRYPVGSNLVNGLWQMAGVQSVAVFRWLPIGCSLVAVVLWFGLYRRIVGRGPATLAAMTMALSYGFLAYADNLHFHGYAMLTSVAAMRCYLRAMGPAEPGRLRWFLFAALLMFLTAWFTWEYHLWMVLFIALYALLFECPVRRPYLTLLAVPLFGALALQTVQRHLALAEVETAAVDNRDEQGGFLRDAYRRALGFEISHDTPRGLTLAGYPKFLLLRYYKFYGLPAVAGLAMIILLLMPDRRPPWKLGNWPNEAKLTVVLFMAGLGWWLVMMQHTAVHPHSMRHHLPAYALLMALVWLRCWKTIRSAAFRLPARVTAVLLTLVLCYPQIEGLVCVLRLHYQENYRAARDRGTSGVSESRVLSPLREVVPSGAVILTNHNRLPLVRFWSGRPVYSGTLRRFSPNDRDEARPILELRFNHLRALYDDSLPSLYYVFRFLGRTARASFDADPVLRLLLLGDTTGGEPAWERGGPILAEAWTTGRCDRSYCPIVASIRRGNMLTFQLDQAVPILRNWWDSKDPPTLRQFGQPR